MKEDSGESKQESTREDVATIHNDAKPAPHSLSSTASYELQQAQAEAQAGQKEEAKEDVERVIGVFTDKRFQHMLKV